jgi:hypothetical protein
VKGVRKKSLLLSKENTEKDMIDESEDEFRWEVSEGESMSPTTYVPTITKNSPTFPQTKFVATEKKFPMQEETKTNTEGNVQTEDVQNMMKKVGLLELDDTVPDKFDLVIEAIAVANKVLRIVIKMEKFEEFVDMKVKIDRMSNYLAMELGAKTEGVSTTEITLDMRSAAIMRSLANCFAALSLLQRKMADYYGLLANGILDKIKTDEEKKKKSNEEKKEEA